MPVPTRSSSHLQSDWPALAPRAVGEAATSRGTQHSEVPLHNIENEHYASGYTNPSQFLSSAIRTLPMEEVSDQFNTGSKALTTLCDVDISHQVSRDNIAHLKGLLAILNPHSPPVENRAQALSLSPAAHGITRVFASSFVRTSSNLEAGNAPEVTNLWRRSVDHGGEQGANSPACCPTCRMVPREVERTVFENDVKAGGVLVTAFTTEPEVFAPLCEPFSFWIADYIWRVVTTGMTLTRECVGPALTVQDPQSILPLLAESISSLLLSTLLQPSAIFLALHYISRLPSYIGPCVLDADPESTKSQFRKALASADATSHECPVTRTLYASFKLFVVGAILSNKILDDHVFTLKTWHEISGLPLMTLNRLEWLGLEILDHELYVHPLAWDQWLGDLQTYHRTFASPGRLLDGASNLVSSVLHGLIAAQAPFKTNCINTNPVFLGIDDRARGKVTDCPYSYADDCEFGLDENGPLRAEYIPKRTSRSHDLLPSAPRYVHSTWLSPASEEVKPSSREYMITPAQCWPVTPLDNIPPTLSGVELTSQRWTVSDSTQDRTVGEFPDLAKHTTIRDYYLACSRIQGATSSTWIPNIA